MFVSDYRNFWNIVVFGTLKDGILVINIFASNDRFRYGYIILQNGVDALSKKVHVLVSKKGKNENKERKEKKKKSKKSNLT